MMAQTTWTRARMCFWGIISHCSLFRGSKPPNPQFWGVNRCFQTKLAKSKKRAYYQNYCIDFNQILHSDKGHQRPFVGGPDTHNKSKMADDGKIEKLPYIGLGLTDFDEILLDDAVRHT